MKKIKREDINSMGKILYGSAIVLTAQGLVFPATVIFLVAIMTILLSLKKDHKEYVYNVAFLHEISLGLWPAAFVELVLGDFVTVAVIILMIMGLNITKKSITKKDKICTTK